MKIHTSPDQLGGVWANAAAVRHSHHEFTIDFIRCDFAADGRATSGVLVQRVNMSPLFVSQLITSLQENWSLYADKAMPRELRDDLALDFDVESHDQGHRSDGGPSTGGDQSTGGDPSTDGDGNET